MTIASRLDRLHAQARANRWLRYFAVFNRVALAAGFLPAGITKIMDERFASGLSVNHPMGHYLEALHHTGFYYPFIGVVQILAAILLLVPRTVLLGAILYFPVILNICILSYAVRFEGSILTSPLMVLSSLFLICWNYDQIKYIFPFHHAPCPDVAPSQDNYSNKFPIKFFSGVVVTIMAIVLFNSFAFDVMPRNSLRDCTTQFVGTNRTKAGAGFCHCIHTEGQPLDDCLEIYENAPDDSVGEK
jgi:uncharacterized membrane protein YphA (DoxX/SURF4 family)